MLPGPVPSPVAVSAGVVREDVMTRSDANAEGILTAVAVDARSKNGPRVAILLRPPIREIPFKIK